MNSNAGIEDMHMTSDTALVDLAWWDANKDRPDVCLIEIDWEGTEAYEAGHIPGALGWNWKDMLWDPLTRDFPSPEDFAARLSSAGIGPGTTVVFYGAPVQFGTYAWWVFRYCGHPRVRILDGGKTRWQKAGRALSRDVSVRKPAAYPPPGGPRDETMRVGRDAVLAALHDPGKILLDHRSAEEYNGLLVNVPGKPDIGAERYGRIPGARHLPFTEFLNEDDTFKSADALRAILDRHGATGEKPIISYCRLSHRATLAYFVVTELAGRGNISIYDGSWTEWGSMVGVPIER